jgi:AraC family transcriptional regulator
MVIHLKPALVRRAAEELGLDPDRTPLRPQLSLRDQHIEHIAWALKAELDSDEPVSRLYVDSLGTALAAHLLRRYAPAVPRRVTRGLSQRQLKRVTDYIYDHLAQDLTLADVARVANLSSSHFKLLFKQSVGMPVHQSVIRCRVEFALILIEQGKLPLAEFALRAGFANQSHLARWVKRTTGRTPSGFSHSAN